MFRYSIVQCALNVFWIQWEPCFGYHFVSSLVIFFSFKYGAVSWCGNVFFKFINNSWREQRKSPPWRRFGYMILIIIKFGELLLWTSLRINNSLRSYIKHSKESFIRYPSALKLVKKKLGYASFLQSTLCLISDTLANQSAQKALFTLRYILKRVRSNIGTAPSRIVGVLLQYFHQYGQRNHQLRSLHGFNSGRTGWTSRNQRNRNIFEQIIISLIPQT